MVLTYTKNFAIMYAVGNSCYMSWEPWIINELCTGPISVIKGISHIALPLFHFVHCHPGFLFRAWISNYILVEPWDVITHPCPNLDEQLHTSHRNLEYTYLPMPYIDQCSTAVWSHYIQLCNGYDAISSLLTIKSMDFRKCRDLSWLAFIEPLASEKMW